MPIVRRSTLVILAVLSAVAVLAIVSFVMSGVYNVGADDAHTRPVHLLLQTLRERSIEQRARGLSLPPLDDAARIKQGAGNYDAMCSGCHLAPGVAATEISKGLNPAAPNLTLEPVPPREAFWTIKHGVKASGMPAWGRSMEDVYIWNMVAFLQQLPKLDEAQYKILVASSGGHSHGGGETSEHHHDKAGAPEGHQDEGEAGHHHEEGESADHDMAGMDMKTGESEGHSHGQAAPTQGETHVHADGTKHVHAPKAGATPAVPKPAATVPAEADTKPSPDTAVEPEQHEHQH
jgi:mono/diheme cytochrome c family protein